MKVVEFESFEKFLNEVEVRGLRGNTVRVAYLPGELKVGVIDETEEEHLLVGLKHIRDWKNNVGPERVRIISEALSTAEGSKKLLERN